MSNTGKTAGAEIVQVYASQPKASVLRPVKELKAFKKVQLNAGETTTVELKIKTQELAYYNNKTQSWVVEPGEFILQTAASSANIKGKVVVKIK